MKTPEILYFRKNLVLLQGNYRKFVAVDKGGFLFLF